MSTVATVSEHRQGRSEAAGRTFEVLTAWLQAHPHCTLTTYVEPRSKRVHLRLTTLQQTHTFKGDDLQDAYAQAAQTIVFSGGKELA